jgi:hypothetical protein
VSGKDKTILHKVGPNTSDAWTGRSVDTAGDLNGDGYADFVVGSPKDLGLGSAIVYSGNPLPPATYTTFGTGCAGTATPPMLVARTMPVPGQAFTLEIQNLRPGPGFLVLGGSDKSWSGLSLPLDLGPIRMPGCNLLVSWETEFPIFALAGTYRFTVTVPEQIPLSGNTFFNQVWVLDANANPLGIATSNAGRGVIGK